MLVHWILFAVLVPLEISTLSKTEHVKLALRNVVGSEKHLSHGQSVEDVQHRRVSAWTGLRIFAHRSFTENTKNELDSEVHHGYVLKDKGVLSKMLPEDMSGPTIDKSSYETTEMTHSKTEKRSSTKRTISTLAQLLTRTPVKEEYKQLKLKIKTLKNRDLARKCTEVPLSNCGNCDNDGTCRQHNWYDNVYFCECQEPYYGDHCEFVDYSWCENECQNGGTCETMVNNDAGEVYHQCVCDSLRYYGDFCQYGMDCTSPGCECLNGGYCHVDYDAEGVLYSFCICNWLFYGGDHCQDLVGDMVTEQMANDVYSACADDCEHGWCDESDTCQCDNGYSGINCEIGNGNDVFTTPDVDVIGATTEQANIIANIVSSSCAEDCVHGSCDESGICKCDDGYSGMYCLIDDYTVCLATCQHGLCDINGVCICHVGFNGNNCEHITDEMSVVTDESALAGNGAITIQVVDFDDATTEQAIILEHYVSSAVSSLCAGLCEHGWCDEFHNCKCDAGYSGNYCEIENSCAATCASGLCDESGLCVCFEGYYGVHCDDKDQFCHTGRPCSNGGTCHSVFVGDGKIFDSYCQCAGAYLGHHCDEDCFATCEHGLCDVYGACVCDEGYHGDKCEHIAEVSVQSEESDATECGQLCQNGTCNEYGECICEYGYHGSYCENKDVSINTVDESECGQLCQNGTCNEYGECICEYGYHGSYCENKDVSMNTVDESECGQLCQNGTCNEYGECICEYGYHGNYCENEDVSINTVDESECGQLCQNGTCNEYGECICEYGYHGNYCENEDVSINAVDESECGQLCQNGTCNEYGECICEYGYHGNYCENEDVSINTVDESECGQLCQNGTCNEYGECICEYGYHGNYCENEDVSINAVDESECGQLCQNGTCNEYGECICEYGYHGNYCENEDVSINTVDESECGQLCQNGTCNEYGECICQYGYHGIYCENEDVSINTVDESECGQLCNNGTCNEYGECICEYGYHGKYCENEDVSINTVDESAECGQLCQNGTCNEYGECICEYGYHGKYCENEDVSINTVDESAECGQLCQNGTCNEYGECICQYGYHGKYCENEDVSINTVDESDSECMAQQVNDMLCGGCNTGTCLNYICCNSEPSCYCMWPYDGLHCEIDMDDVPSSCKLENCNDHGDCIVNKYHQYGIGPEYLCDCKYPFTGSRCQIKADDCHGNCSEHGVCKSYKDENKNSIAVCECDFGYEGSYCQVDLRATQHDDCPCQNGGMCYKDPIYEVEYCICASPFEGPLCERDISCDSCQNGGSCVEHDIVNPTGSETQITKLCECVYPYMGTHCEIDGDCTKYNICKNGGTCVTCNANEYHYCECPLPYFGEFCQESLNDYMLNGSDLQNTMED